MVNGSDASFMFGYNFSVDNLTFMPDGKLQRRSHIINHHHNRESQAKGIIKSLNINGNDNPAYIVTNIHASNTWFLLMKPLLFWSDMNFLTEQVVAEGIEKGHQHPLSLKLRSLHSSPSRFILGLF